MQLRKQYSLQDWRRERNRRERTVNPIPESIKKTWDEWNIQGVILFSLSLQAFLVLFAHLRKGAATKLIIILI